MTTAAATAISVRLAPGWAFPFRVAAGAGSGGDRVDRAAAVTAVTAYHRPVMTAEVVAALAVRAGGVYLDGTLGEGGHCMAILEQCAPDGTALGIDRDPRSVAVARRRLAGFGSRAVSAQGSYADLARIAGEQGISSVDGVLLDLGFSSRQVEEEGYGFSFQRDEPLDMRFDPSGGEVTAFDIVNDAGVEELADLIFRFGEERRSRAIARAIVAGRPVNTTGQLAQIVARACGGRRGGGRDRSGSGRGRHPATRTFQALRIAVNRELEHLEAGLAAVLEVLAPGGRLAVISYHSLEDRIVKEWLRRESGVCVCPPGLPVCGCGRRARLRLMGRRVIRPSAAEVAANPRSRSARLRAAERIPEGDGAESGDGFAGVAAASSEKPAAPAGRYRQKAGSDGGPASTASSSRKGSAQGGRAKDHR